MCILIDVDAFKRYITAVFFQIVFNTEESSIGTGKFGQSAHDFEKNPKEGPASKDRMWLHWYI